MENLIDKVNTCSTLFIFFFFSFFYASPSQAKESNIPIIQITQTGCQFLEPEAKDYQYHTTQFSDCQNINQQSSENRPIRTLHLKAGKYIFRVSNKNVPYDLGFWLRGSKLNRFLLPHVSGGGLSIGQTKDYPIHLKAGTYYYSCPLNPTPNYLLTVD